MLMEPPSDKLPILPLRPSPTPSTSPPSSQDGSDTTKSAKRAVRASKPKVRTGCQTCKIRRVKCDEAKPECNRCTSTGRQCDGYYIPPRKNQAGSKKRIIEENYLPGKIGPGRNLTLVRATQSESQALEFFHTVTAPGMSLFFDSDFWMKLVLQMSFSEPAIKHAMVATGSLHRKRDIVARQQPVPTLEVIASGCLVKVEMPAECVAESDQDDPFAMGQYNKAISLLAQRLQKPDGPPEVALLACILFVGFEFLRGDAPLALKHFQSGMNIALATLSKADSKSSPALQRMRDQMLPFFNRLELLSTLFGHEVTWEYPVDIEEACPLVLTSLHEARNSLVHLMNLSLRFIRTVKYRKYGSELLSEELSREKQLRSGLMNWKYSLDDLVRSGKLSQKELDAVKILHVDQLIALVWLSTCTYPDECANDQYMPLWEKVITLAEEIQANADTPNQRQHRPSSFLFDMEIVSPLYWAAIKCRHPQIRRRIIALLQKMQRREGLWESRTAAGIAERIMTIEEKHLKTLDGSEFPLEHHRIHNSQITSNRGSQKDVHSVTFYMLPDGLKAPWHAWTETLIIR